MVAVSDDIKVLLDLVGEREALYKKVQDFSVSDNIAGLAQQGLKNKTSEINRKQNAINRDKKAERIPRAQIEAEDVRRCMSREAAEKKLGLV